MWTNINYTSLREVVVVCQIDKKLVDIIVMPSR